MSRWRNEGINYTFFLFIGVISLFPCRTLKDKRDAYVARLNGIYFNNLEKDGVELIRGTAKFTGIREVTVNGEKYTADHVCIATGGHPVILDVPGEL